MFTLVARFLVPKEIVYSEEKTLYLNINVVWDSWKDVKKIYICSLFDGFSIVYLKIFTFFFRIWNRKSCLFFVCAIFLELIQFFNLFGLLFPSQCVKDKKR